MKNKDKQIRVFFLMLLCVDYCWLHFRRWEMSANDVPARIINFHTVNIENRCTNADIRAEFSRIPK